MPDPAPVIRAAFWKRDRGGIAGLELEMIATENTGLQRNRADERKSFLYTSKNNWNTRFRIMLIIKRRST